MVILDILGGWDHVGLYLIFSSDLVKIYLVDPYTSPPAPFRLN